MIKWILRGQIACDPVQISVRLLNRYARFQAADGAPATVTSRAFRPNRIVAIHVRYERRPELGFALRCPNPEIGNFTWRHPHNAVRLVVDSDRLAQDRAIPVKTRLPEAVTDNGYEVVSPTVLFIFKKPADLRLDAENFEILPGNQSDAHLFRFRRTTAEADVLSPHIVNSHFFKCVILGSKV